MKYVTQNGWTKARMIEQIQTKMLDHQSADASGNCLYRAEDGNRCAVGVFIPDELYSADFEGRPALGLTSFLPSLLDVLPLHRSAMSDFQGVHDSKAHRWGGDPRPLLVQWINENVEDAPSAPSAADGATSAGEQTP